MDQSQASMLLSSKKFEGKAKEVLKSGLEASPRHVTLEKKLGGGEHRDVILEGPTSGAGGVMLYTSGTTNRPVCVMTKATFQFVIQFININIERCSTS
jgi:malonyl-CoA/methylmalonyl-CoA synthetase